MESKQLNGVDESAINSGSILILQHNLDNNEHWHYNASRLNDGKAVLVSAISEKWSMGDRSKMFVCHEITSPIAISQLNELFPGQNVTEYDNSTGHFFKNYLSRIPFSSIKSVIDLPAMKELDYRGEEVDADLEYVRLGIGYCAGYLALKSICQLTIDGWALEDENEIHYCDGNDYYVIEERIDYYDLAFVGYGSCAGELHSTCDLRWVEGSCNGWYHEDDEDRYFWYDSRNDEYIDDEDAIGSSGNRHGYHEGNRHSFTTLDTKFTIGFEVEKEDESVLDEYDLDEADNTFWSREEDGSLDDVSGFEFVSPVYDLFTDSFIKSINNPVVKAHINANVTRQCGGHINLGCTDMSGAEFYDSISGFVPIMMSLYHRRVANGSWARFGKKSNYKNGNKYNAVNVKGSFIEFRMPSGVRDVANITWRFELMRILCAQVSSGNASNFMYWVEQMLTPDTELRNHLLKVYSERRLNRVIVRACAYAEHFLEDSVKYLSSDVLKASCEFSEEAERESLSQFSQS